MLSSERSTIAVHHQLQIQTYINSLSLVMYSSINRFVAQAPAPSECQFTQFKRAAFFTHWLARGRTLALRRGAATVEWIAHVGGHGVASLDPAGQFWSNQQRQKQSVPQWMRRVRADALAHGVGTDASQRGVTAVDRWLAEVAGKAVVRAARRGSHRG